MDVYSLFPWSGLYIEIFYFRILYLIFTVSSWNSESRLEMIFSEITFVVRMNYEINVVGVFDLILEGLWRTFRVYSSYKILKYNPTNEETNLLFYYFRIVLRIILYFLNLESNLKQSWSCPLKIKKNVSCKAQMQHIDMAWSVNWCSDQSKYQKMYSKRT